ncbi:MAG: hypothetical protein MK005_06005 [Alcanivorax sp.]|nr:hypothetical protein [Alcanivorax sp.]
MNNFKGWVLRLLLVGIACGAMAEEPDLIIEDGYVLEIFSDGSGSLGRQFDPKATMSCKSAYCEYKRKNADSRTTFRDTWSFQIKKDAMSDEKTITLTRKPHEISEEFGEIEFNSDIYLWINLRRASREMLCVAGHDYSGLTAMIRVDSAKPMKTNENGCVLLSSALNKQLVSGSKLVIRGSHWPYQSPETQNISLDGYKKITQFLRDRRT